MTDVGDVKYTLYIIECADKTLYTGITTDIVRRFKEHQQKIGSHYTGAKGVREVVYTEDHPNRSSASKREAEIKKWTRKQKLELIISSPSTQTFL